MAKATVTFEDCFDGETNVKIVFTPSIKTKARPTPAQALAMKCITIMQKVCAGEADDE